MTFILVITLFVNGASVPVVTSVPMTKAQCEMAKKNVITSVEKYSVTCMEKNR